MNIKKKTGCLGYMLGDGWNSTPFLSRDSFISHLGLLDGFSGLKDSSTIWNLFFGTIARIQALNN